MISTTGAVAPMLIGTGHLLFTDRDTPPQVDAVRRMVRFVLNAK